MTEPEETDRPTSPETGRAAPRKTPGNASRAVTALRRRFGGAGPVGLAVLALGVTAAVLMIVAELSTVLTIEVNGIPCPSDISGVDDCTPSGGSRHYYALVLLGLLAAVMAFGAGLGHSRPAAAALAAVGVAVLSIALIADLPDVNDTGFLRPFFEDATARPSAGFWLELVAGALALLAGGLQLLRGR